MEWEQVILGGLGFLGVCTTALCGVLVAKINNAHKSAQEAVELARPTGNGFAASVTSALAELKNTQNNMNTRLSSVEASQNITVSSVVNLSAQLGQVIGRVDKIDRYNPINEKAS